MVLRCTECRVPKPSYDFSPGTKKNGLRSQCKACNNTRSKQRYSTHREEVIARTKQWQLDNPEWRKEIADTWYKENAEYKRTSVHDWRIRNYERSRATVDRWQKANKQKVRRIASRAQRTRKARLRAIRPLTGHHTETEWQNKLAWYGGCCAYCDTSEKITRDHIIPLTRGGTDLIENIQPLCWSCNSYKGARMEWEFNPIRHHRHFRIIVA